MDKSLINMLLFQIKVDQICQTSRELSSFNDHENAHVENDITLL